MKKIKLIQIVEDLKVGGLEKVIFNITMGLPADKYDIEIWCLARGGAIAEELSAKGKPVKVIGITNYHHPFQLLKLIGMLKKAKPDIVHTHGYFAGTAGRLAAIFSGTQTIIHHVHSTYWGFRRHHLRIEKILSRWTNKVICCSKAITNFVVDIEKISPDKVQIIYNGIELSPVDEGQSERIKKELGIQDGESLIATVASLTPHKGHRYLLDAAEKIIGKYPGTKFIFIGDGPCRKDLEEQTRLLKIEPHIIFAGIRDNVAPLVSLADIVILPSCEREGLGIALIEGMALGKPCIGTNLGGIPEVISDNQTGILVPPADSYQLVLAIERLLTDKNGAERMGIHGEKVFREKFLASQMIKQLEQVYAQSLH